MYMELAIVIPAYKGQFLGKTLDALCAQTNHEFNVYIGDDCSMDSLYSIVEPYTDRLNISYHYFDTNLGGRSLTSQWDRCIGLVNEEKWIWCLPDDDVPSIDCVEEFYNAINNCGNENILYRFNSRHINESDAIIRTFPSCPDFESNIQFFINKLRFIRNSTLAEYIFSKKAFLEAGGFFHLPLAWGSDDLMWINLSYEHDIVTLSNAMVSLRQSPLNISNNQKDHLFEKFEAKYQLFSHLLADSRFVDKLNSEAMTIGQLRDEITKHLFFEYRSHNYPISIFNLLLLALKNDRLMGGGLFRNVYRLILFKTKRFNDKS